VSVFTEALQNAWENHKLEKLTVIDGVHLKNLLL